MPTKKEKAQFVSEIATKDEAFFIDAGRKCFKNAKQMESGYRILSSKEHHQSAYNLLFISTEEFLKAIYLFQIALFKKNKKPINIKFIEELCDIFFNHEKKIGRAFAITIKHLRTSKVISSQPIILRRDENGRLPKQVSITTTMEEGLKHWEVEKERIINTIQKMSPKDIYAKKNNAIYVNYNFTDNTFSHPEEISNEVSRSIVWLNSEMQPIFISYFSQYLKDWNK